MFFGIYLICKVFLWGRPGFDVGCDARGACRGCNLPRKSRYKFIVANKSRNDAVFAGEMPVELAA